MADVRVDVVADRTYQVKTAIRSAIRKALVKSGLDIEGQAKLNITDLNRIDTGACRASIYVSVEGFKGYSPAISEAKSLAAEPGKKSKRPNTTAIYLPEMRAGENEAIVAVGVHYAEMIELGTVHMPPTPFLGPAAELVLAQVDKVVAKIIDKELK